MNRFIAITLLLSAPLVLNAQQSFERETGDFNRLVLSPHINLVLETGDTPGVRIEYDNVDKHEINVEVNGSTLRIYLEHAKMIEKTEQVNYHYSKGIYDGAEVTAYVTFTELEMLEIRGDQWVKVQSPINARQFKLKIYGENDVTFDRVNAEYFKVSLFGENELTVKNGDVEYQKYTLYGDNSVEVSGLKSQHTNTKIYGESELSLYASHELEITSFGEPIITYAGDPIVNKGIIIGEPRIFGRD
ncbi:head GIN domain-containing protein [Fulvivirga sedimenti]|uniref:DUF2807 domain-containing protein n=1 Tax=Fulvivirga sedimenti TaxID=2879465 RepID=A0A9X1HSH6_9BACT|nr:head GIN domain-containing protein [Fulvivirga sedimenti]MCA6074825.1 DUF2807 domain-containing protein [Fulvivirga sedimenti]MCA6076002.1 DUF2807 domain-containing protein [Fulvivirga sedimenti]MCA6077130.1 DUF2807 domain-containing protein [Fulvivirga sedimenti]